MEKLKEKVDVENLIYEIRGLQVMLDSDLAKLYKCTNGTKDINKAVNRNIDRFPNDFYFQITKEEYYNILRFQNGTLEFKQGKYSKYLPYAFTEQGVAMLSSVLKSEVASKVSVDIMRAFVYLRRYVVNKDEYITSMILKHDNEIKLLQDAFDKFKPKINQIYFNG